MGNTKSIIEKNKLDGRVAELMSGVFVAREIRDILQEENPGLEISYSSVSRFVRAIKNSAENDAEQSIRRHLNRVVPDDLDTLEELESMCMEWAREAGLDQARWIARAEKELAEEIPRWLEALNEADDPGEAAKSIIGLALPIIARDDRRQKKRLEAMKQAVDIISLKLRNEGLLDTDKAGKICIYMSKAACDGDGGGGDDEYRPMNIPMGMSSGGSMAESGRPSGGAGAGSGIFSSGAGAGRGEGGCDGQGA